MRWLTECLCRLQREEAEYEQIILFFLLLFLLGRAMKRHVQARINASIRAPPPPTLFVAAVRVKHSYACVQLQYKHSSIAEDRTIAAKSTRRQTLTGLNLPTAHTWRASQRTRLRPPAGPVNLQETHKRADTTHDTRPDDKLSSHSKKYWCECTVCCCLVMYARLSISSSCRGGIVLVSRSRYSVGRHASDGRIESPPNGVASGAEAGEQMD